MLFSQRITLLSVEDLSKMDPWNSSKKVAAKSGEQKHPLLKNYTPVSHRAKEVVLFQKKHILKSNTYSFF